MAYSKHNEPAYDIFELNVYAHKSHLSTTSDLSSGPIKMSKFWSEPSYISPIGINKPIRFWQDCGYAYPGLIYGGLPMQLLPKVCVLANSFYLVF